MLVLALLCASWGLQQVAIKLTNHAVAPVWQSGLRSIGATVLVWVWMVARRQPLLAKDGTGWWGLAAGLLFAGEFLLIYWGLEFTNASRAVVFLYTAPFVVALGVKIFIPGEHLGPAQVAGLGCAFSGIVVAFGESVSLPTGHMLVGDVMLAGAAVFWGAATVVVKASPLARIASAKTLLYQLAVSAVALPLGSLAMGESWQVQWRLPVVLSMVYQTVWVATITYLAWFWLIRRYPASRLAAFTFLTPLFGVAFGGALLDEPLTGGLLIALALVGAGIYLVNRPR